ncbi:SAM domain and HD domain-containing protein 1, partial [Caligus rogercresseyi]
SFIRKLDPGREWTHEENSIKILDKLIENNGLWPFFKEQGLTEKDLIFIKEAIGGPMGASDNKTEEQNKYLGRGPEKYFLYEIVANKKTGMYVINM